MFHTDIGDEFVRMSSAAGWGPTDIRTFCLTAVDASWMPDDERRVMRAQVELELDELASALGSSESVA